MAIEMKPDQEGKVRLEMDVSTLSKLMESGALSANAFRCLDCDSKECVWRLCLSSCAKCVNYAREKGVAENDDIEMIFFDDVYIDRIN